MKNLFAAIFIMLTGSYLHAQYYYKDIIGTRDFNKTIQLYLSNKVASVEETGFDAEGMKNDDFSETHNLFTDQGLLKIATRNKTEISNEYYRFNEKGLLTTITDTSSSLVSTTTYSYDDKNNAVLIKNVVNDANDSIYVNEEHLWFYNDQNKPVRMLRIVNKTDTTDVRLTLDEKGNVIEELPFINKISREKIYYYYDSKNRLTDIVRFNTKAGRLLPDYMFEYSDNNQVIQKITTIASGDVGYIIWRYSYGPSGLKAKEASFNKDKTMIGKIEYAYQFGQ